jgi:hypothetical protein
VSDQNAKNSDLVEIAKRNGDFRKNYGLIIGAFLYLRSIQAARPGSLWVKALFGLATAAFAIFHPHTSIEGRINETAK